MPLSLFHLHGDLKDIRFAKILSTLRDDRFAGVFQVTTPTETSGADEEIPEETTREIHFADGHVAWAISTDKRESLRSFLQQEHKISDPQWAAAEERAHEGTLRQALADLGLVDPAGLEKIERHRAEQIVLELFSAAEGEYRIRERQLSPGTPDLEIDARSIILTGIVQRADRDQILEEIGSLDTVYAVDSRALDRDGLKLPGEFQPVLGRIDGTRSIAEICSATSLPDHYACSLFAALSMIGVVVPAGTKDRQKRSVRPAAPEPDKAGPRAPSAARLPVFECSPAAGGLPDAVADLETVGATELPDAAHGSNAEDAGPPIDSYPPADEILEERETEHPGFDGEVPVPPPTWATEPPAPRRPSRAASVESDGEPPPLETGLEEAPPSAYGDYARQEGARPWILLGGAATVGLLALFIILMAQDRGAAGQRPGAVAVLEDPLADELDTGADAETAEEPDNRNTPHSPVQREPAPQEQETIVAAATKPNMLNEDAGDGLLQRGRRSLERGNLRSAASYFDRGISRAGQYTIQLLTACQDETIGRAVSEAGNHDDLFILPTTVEGRSCYRMLWGTYGSRERAIAALGRDVPAFFRHDRNPPRVVPLDKL